MKKKTLEIFKQENDDGLSDAILASASLAYFTQLWDTKVTQEVARHVLATTVDDQFDLYYLNTILVTTGWNKNTDVFPRSEVWKARYTPIDKQFNLEHDQSRIIGHMTTAVAVNAEFQPIAEDTSIDLLPDKFHILTGAVIYRALSDPEAQDNIENLIAEIEDGQWYVSMECLFRGFDYAFIKADGSQGFIERTEESAFLTKHLRQYGGTGEYKDLKLGRALKNITFSGKGLVRKPANPESIIFNQAVAEFNEKYNELVYIFNNDENNNSKHEVETFVMADNAEVNKELEKRVNELAEANKTLVEQVKTFESSQTTAKITSLEADIAVKSEKIVSLEAALADAKTLADNLTVQVEELNKNLVKANVRTSELESQMAAARKEEKARARLALLTDLKASKEQAENLVKLLADKSDEEFSVLANMLVKPSSASTTNTSEVIDTADPVEDAPLTTSATQMDDDIEKKRLALANYFENQLNNKKGDRK